ncbi:MAG: hypothetical protein HEP71_03650 [Roseivirga sp.]|nr:hypothetical protein [Roseivirga sp.]
MKRIFPYLVLSLFILTNCGQSKNQDKISESEEQTSETSETSGEREPTDEEIREYGILTSIEDAPYPMFSIDVEFPEREMKMSFLFNVEESPLDMTELLEMKGKYATIYYTSDGEPDIYDIHRECESLLGEDAIDINEADQEITGIVSGAESQTTGDLPDELTITSRDGTKMTFQCFITEEMAAANGEEVTVFYRVHYRNTITYLKASEDD